MLRRNRVNFIQGTIAILTALMLGVEIVTLIAFQQPLHLPVIIGIACGISLFFEQGKGS
ncbi:hypothetical protein [Pseudolactococcus reticulitermitis]|uniref:hypothetical protein n=1 Tax=Pseudolactococcus reticulitermitis TaxID=2025039 RepID=UPI0012FFD00C|nr:hypothetical protein [Lactococcus reticulitermitis]